MGMIRIYQGKSKPAKKKPGWRQAEAEYKAWQDKVNSVQLFATKPKPKVIKTKIDPVVRGVQVRTETTVAPVSKYVPGAGAKPVHRPDILYRDNPEMLARELAARERKFNAAPAYNKGGDQFVTEEMLQQLLASNKRRS